MVMVFVVINFFDFASLFTSVVNLQSKGTQASSKRLVGKPEQLVVVRI